MSPRVLVVGFDGATFDIIKPMVADGRSDRFGGRLPTLAHLMQQGAWGTLQSNIPPVTPSAWTSVFTGKNPGKHGIYDFDVFDRQTRRLRGIRADEHSEKTVWQLLGEAGKRSIVLDVPFTYPPQPLNGLMLTGYGTPRTPETVFTYPSHLADHLPANLHAELRVALPRQRFDRSQSFIDEWSQVMNGRRQLLHHLIEHEAWDFFMVVFSITDNMAHVFWTYVDPAHPNYYRAEAEAFREAFWHGYELCDQLLGELIEKAGPDSTTLVLSDHGFGSVRPRQYIYQRLLQGGYITPISSSDSVSLRAHVMKTAVSTYNRFPFLREWVKGMRPDNLNSLKKTLNQAGMIVSDKNLDVARSRVIPSSFGLSMWVTDDGRARPNHAAQKEALLTELSKFLLADRDKVTGQPIIAQTYRGADIYHGPFMENAPDLVLEYANFFQPEATAVRRNPHIEGGHTPDGIFLAYGTAVQPTQMNNASLIDLAPTILHLLEQPIPPDMDGRVLTAALDAGYLARHPIHMGSEPARVSKPRQTTDFTAEEEQELNEQLRQLGYVE